MSGGGVVVTAGTVADLVPDRWWPVEVPGVGLLWDGIPVQVTLTWDADEPYEVSFKFRNGPTWVPWVVSRELVTLGLIENVEDLVEPFEDRRCGAGEGDVRFELLGNALLMSLCSPAGFARFLFNPAKVAGFLSETYRHTPLGSEQVSVDWDQLLVTDTPGGAA